jgi:hypothetical protein
MALVDLMRERQMTPDVQWKTDHLARGGRNPAA